MDRSQSDCAIQGLRRGMEIQAFGFDMDDRLFGDNCMHETVCQEGIDIYYLKSCVG